MLSGRPGWQAVEVAYQKALQEIADDEGDDAITEAGMALQETLKLLGCDGNSLGPLIQSARKKDLLAALDEAAPGEGIAKIADWVSADRSEVGDGHKGASRATRDDAWLAVHVVGGLILRLAGPARGVQPSAG